VKSVAFGLAFVAAVGILTPPREPRWWKGNTHTHTLWSDGDAAPEWAADGYKSNGYHFLVLSEHNVLPEGEQWKKIGLGKGDMRPETLKPLLEKFGKEVVLRERAGAKEMRLKTLDELRARFEEKDKFLFIPGEEVTDDYARKPIHHNVLNLSKLVKPVGGQSVREVLERTMAAFEEAAKREGRPALIHLNHPNFGWAVEPDDLAYVKSERYFEVYSGHAGARTAGDARHKSCEQLWDYVLSIRLGKIGGELLYGLATDDAHQYFAERAVSRPGRGWVMVRAEELSADAILKAMQAGDFYASSGVTLESIVSDASSLTVRVAAEPGVKYRIRFNGTRGGAVGAVLQESEGTSATYAFKGDELYVRATVVSNRKHPNGYFPEDVETAWAQPVVVKRK
jgi:hypothetical protein